MQTLDLLRSGALTGTRRLDLNGAGLTHLPPEVYGLADTLEVLNLSDNQLTSLPPDLPRLHRLKVIFCSGNPFTHLPEVLGDCPALEMVGFKACRLQHVPAAALPLTLRWLTLTDNAIGHLPAELGQRPALQKLMLSGNRLSALPDSLASAQRLELVRLSANRFTQLPGWLTDLPALAWLAVSGNPLGWESDAGGPSCAPLTSVPWGALTVDGLLGEGASGHIYRAHRVGECGRASDGDGEGDGIAWALKLFKGAVTSDGLPEHELAACLAAGQHPALCTPVAQLVDHPDGLSGLLLPLIPPDFVNLAGPPSLSSCTRDVYAPGLQMDGSVLLRVALTVASAVAHLHARGVVHGDLYAHNILWQPTSGQALLSDFGAATLLPAHQPTLGHALQALEVLAYGHLLNELRALLAPGQCLPPAVAALALACTAAVPTHRPDMAAVATTLQTLLPATL
jgi:hypothetical protein